MARVIVLGAGVCGLAAGIMLARDGYEVTVVERDAGAVPRSNEEAWDEWVRDGVAQFRQPHYLQPRGRVVLEEALPDVAAALEAAGAVRFNPLRLMPPTIADRSPREGDDRFRTITARRPVLERILARTACDQPGLEIRQGVTVRELIVTHYDRLPHVVGVRTGSGDALRGDLVIDAMDRRSQLPRWLSAAGTTPVHEEVEDPGFIYYTRYFRSLDGTLPEFRAPLLTALGSVALVVLPGDNATWSVTIFLSAGDRPLKRLRVPELWAAVVAASPRHAQWLDGEPISDLSGGGRVHGPVPPLRRR